MPSAPLRSLSLALGLLSAACAHSASPVGSNNPSPKDNKSTAAPSPDPRVGLHAGLMNAGEAVWNLRVLSQTPPSEQFLGITNSDLSFTSHYAIQGSYSGYQVWDITDPRKPALTTAYVCPASQSDVSVYQNLLIVSGENLSARLDCGTQGVEDMVSSERLRGVRIFDISDIAHPKNVGNVQTCRGSHTHSLLVDPRDPENVYVYISGSSGVRSPNELAGCVKLSPDQDPNSALFRIEVIKVPLAHPEQAAVVTSPPIFNDLTEAATHAEAPEDIAAATRAADSARAVGGFTARVRGVDFVLGPGFTRPMLDSVVKARQGTGAP